MGLFWSKMDIEAFASILLEIVVGRPAKGEASVPTGIPAFISEIIETGLWLKFGPKCSFYDIFEIPKQNEFRIEDDVGSVEVSAFANWVELVGQSENQTQLPYLVHRHH
jgi:hypothetical protein